MRSILVPKKRAYDSLDKYLLLLYKLFVSEKRVFDLVVAPANSGTSMMYIFKEMMNCLGLPIPVALDLPIFRKEKLGYNQNHANLIPLIKETLRKININSDNILRILFIDDEIGSGKAPRTFIKLLKDALNQLIISPKIHLTIVAEDLGWEGGYSVDTEFIPILKHDMDGVYNVLSGIVPSDLSQKIQQSVTYKELRRTEILNIALGLPIKHIVNNRVGLITVKTSELEHEKKEFVEYLKTYIKNFVARV